LTTFEVFGNLRYELLLRLTRPDLFKMIVHEVVYFSHSMVCLARSPFNFRVGSTACISRFEFMVNLGDNFNSSRNSPARQQFHTDRNIHIQLCDLEFKTEATCKLNYGVNSAGRGKLFRLIVCLSVH